ncbi:MAG: hypothetical protein KDB90_01625 [Planctomycetes bacterium]|nr:hypothetical protein [Planctomycetota bacterium]
MIGLQMRSLVIGLLSLICPAALEAALVVNLVQIPTVSVPRDYTGNGVGFLMGAFEISNTGATGAVLQSITLTAIGSGDDSTAFSEIGLYLDSDGNGSYDANMDTRYGAAYAAYPMDDGSLTYAESTGFASGASKRFLIVGKMNGAVLPNYQQGFRTIVSSVGVTGAVPTGIPTTYTGGVGILNGATPLRLEYDLTGTSAPYDYSFRLLLDNHDGSWISGQAWGGPIIFGQAKFGAAGTTPFLTWVTDSTSYPVGPFDTTGWWASSVGGLPYDAPGLYFGASPFGQSWTPSGVGDQLTWFGTANTFVDDGEMAWSMRRATSQPNSGSATLEPAHRVGDYLRVVSVAGAALDVAPTSTGGGSGFAIGAFDVVSHSNSATLNSITLAASGSGDDSSAFSDVRLFVDSNSNGSYDPGVDTQFGSAYSAYPGDDGSLTFTDALNFSPNETKRLLLVVQLNGPTLATYGQTFDTRVTAISATGNMHSGLPTAVVPGIHIQAPTLTLATSATVQNVAYNEQGPVGIGVQAAEFLLTNNAVGTANLDSITVAAAGSLFDQTGFASVALYEDTNVSGSYDATDVLYAASASAFPADDGSLTFSQSIAFAANQSRRFFLVVRLSGSAQLSDDFWAQVAALGVSGGTETVGVPGTLVECLSINSAAPNPPPSGGAGGDNDSGCSSNSRDSFWQIALAFICLIAAGARKKATTR